MKTDRKRIESILKKSKNKSQMMDSLLKEYPIFFLKYYKNIEKAGDYIFANEISDSSSSESTDSSSSDEEKIKRKRKPSLYNEFVHREIEKLREENENISIKIIAERWRESPENPKNNINRTLC